MKKVFGFFILLTGSLLASSSNQDYYKEGQTYKRNIVNKPALDGSIDPAQQKDKTPTFKRDPIVLKNEAIRQLQPLPGTPESVGRSIISMDKAYTLDPDKDPLIVEGEALLKDPNKLLDAKEENFEEIGEEKREHHLCHEGEESTLETCRVSFVSQKIGETENIVTDRVNIGAEILNNLRSLDDLCLISIFPDSFLHESISPTHPKLLAAFKQLLSGSDSLTHQPIQISPENLRAVQAIGHDGVLPSSKGLFGKDKASARNPVKNYFYLVTHVKKTPSYGLVEQSSCLVLEERIDRGECELVEKHCIDPDKTKIIEGKSVTADCWLEDRKYHCSRKVTNTCKPLRDRGCYQISSKCQVYDDTQKCIQWEQTYECQQGGMRKTSRFTGSVPFCLDGNCHEVSWAPNTDMADSLSKLSVLNAMKSDRDPEKMTVFQGKKLTCSRNPAGFKNCCVKKGWGMKVGLAGCTEKEKELSVERRGDKCVYVGTHCSKEQLGICLEKTSSYCCFGTKLSRIIHEQGRKLLGMNFGTAKEPNCSGFTLSDFTKLDFTKIDLSELFQDLMSKMKVPDSHKQRSKAETRLGTPEKQNEFRQRQENSQGGL
jgi:hypothetical protein